MATILQKRQEILNKIFKLCTQINNNPETIKLIAVSKTFGIEAIVEAFNCGQKDFAENYVQEGVEKIHNLAKYKNEIIWHFIGRIQSNKTKDIAENFSWVHTIDKEKIAKRLNDQRPFELGRLQVCIQVNIDNASTKSGISINGENIYELAKYIINLPNLELRGLMVIPDMLDNKPNIQAFIEMNNLFSNLKAKFTNINSSIDTLCMGMSADFEEAIKYGANMVRIGSAIFGKR